MKKFVFIFRRGSRELTEEEQAQRTNEVRTWVAQQQKDGCNFDPRILADDRDQAGDVPLPHRRDCANHIIQSRDAS